ncbi:ADP-ribosylglycohydrolase family protein [Salana multivorans]
MDEVHSRARGSLLGLALGDALGMPTQCLPFPLVRERYGLLADFEPGPPDNPISAGMAAGHITDDTEQAVLLALSVLDDAAGRGHVDPVAFAQALLSWHGRMVAAGSADLLGPSTLRAVEAIGAGADPLTTGRWGDTNGAAMRIAPIGIAVRPAPLEELVRRVHEVSRPTHDTTVAVAGAAAVAAAVSVAIDGGDVAEATDLAVEAAHLGAELGQYVPGADVAMRIEWALDVVREQPLEAGLELVSELIGTSMATQESVPAAFAILSLTPDPWLAVRAAASLGGDSDTIAAIVGAVAGAAGAAWPDGAVANLLQANPRLAIGPGSLDHLAAQLTNLRTTEATS